MAASPPILPNFGYLTPTLTNSELNDLILRRFLQGLVTGIVGAPQGNNLPGLDPTNVRPRWQPEPPNEPDFQTNWAAIGTIRRTRDVFAAELHAVDVNGNGSDAVIRNEILEILCSFYGPNSEANSELFAMGLSLAQNREAMYLNGFGFVEAGESLNVPTLIKDRWLAGWDIHFRIRRQQIYTYAIPNVVKAVGTIATDAGVTVQFAVVGQGYGISPYSGPTKYGSK